MYICTYICISYIHPYIACIHTHHAKRDITELCVALHCESAHARVFACALLFDHESLHVRSYLTTKKMHRDRDCWFSYVMPSQMN